MTLEMTSPRAMTTRYRRSSWQSLLTDDWRDVQINGDPSADQLVTYAVASALRGDFDGARRFAAEADCASHGERGAIIGADFARAAAWLGQGDCSAAFETLSPHFALAPEPSLVPYLNAVVGVFAESAVRANRAALACSLLSRWMGALTADGMHPTHELELAKAILCDADPEARIRQALRSGFPRGPVTTARLHLALGMNLRRHRRPSESRPHLMVAEELLRASDARPWIGLAERELRASGSRGGLPDSRALLSPQEKSIADLAAQGFTNREIGEMLFLSPRTVSSHLYNAFPKLGISSRRQLFGMAAGA